VFQDRAPGLFLLRALSCGVGAGLVRANLVVNGGFETGNFTGWTLTNGQYTYVTSGNPYDGTYDCFNGEYPLGSRLSQTVDTKAGDCTS
jgi:hypothetical protein